MNFVATNLTYDIVIGKRTVADARREYARLYKAYNDGEHPAYTEEFAFELPGENTADPDIKRSRRQTSFRRRRGLNGRFCFPGGR